MADSKDDSPSNFQPGAPAWLIIISHTVWSVIGLIILVAFLFSFFSQQSLVENLNLSSEAKTTEQTQQTQPQPNQPPQPTQEQLDCVSDELGQERFGELQQGGQATGEEAGLIQNCLQ